jgi:hypothetical protein
MIRQEQILVTRRSLVPILRLKDFLEKLVGWCLEKTGAPAKLRAFEFVDPDSDETIYLYTSKHYSVLCIGDRRLYFDRITGKFDGFSAPTSAVARGIELRD